MKNDTSLESSCALLLEYAKKIVHLLKLNFFSQKSSYIVKMLSRETKNVQTSFDRLFAKDLRFFSQNLQFVFLCQRFSKKLNFIKIWQVKVGQNKDLVCFRQKQSFRQCASRNRANLDYSIIKEFIVYKDSFLIFS